MKTKDELQAIVSQIAKADSPVGMDAVYVHAIIIDKLTQIERRLEALEAAQREGIAPHSDEVPW